jgi:tetratricopeptide (TPR) repeat protein
MKPEDQTQAQNSASDPNLDTNEIITALGELIKQEPSADLYFMRGKLYWRLGRKSDAMTDYEHALELDPNSPARHALEMAHDVMNFYNKDLYNP